MIVVLDTGGVEALAPTDPQRRARLQALRRSIGDVVVPAAVLAEGVFTGRRNEDDAIDRLLDLSTVAVVDEAIGRTAGAVRQQAIRAGLRPPPSGVDAVVVATADRYAVREEVRVVTTDPGDLEMLASLVTNARRLAVERA